MQGKEPSEQETRKCSAGIDVGKSWLDVHMLPSEDRKRFSNDAAGIRQLKRWLLLRKPTVVVIEATGKWHRAVHRSLAASQIAVAVTNPFRVRMFAMAQGAAAKTDRLDARVLALFAALMVPEVRVPAPQGIEELKEIVATRQNAVDEETALKNQLAAATVGCVIRQLTRRIAQLGKHIKSLEKECLKRIHTDAALARRFEILKSVPGCGEIVAMTLVACLDELGTLTAKQIARLTGLAPLADDSGQRHGVRVIAGGRGSVRRILYLAAVTAARVNPDLKTFYERLRTNGKEAKVALVAVARKLAIIANTLIVQDRLWQPHAPKPA